MRWCFRMFYIPMLAVNAGCDLILKLLGLEADHHEAHTEQELRMLLFASQATGSFSFNQLLMVENLFDLSKQTVRRDDRVAERANTVGRYAAGGSPANRA